MISGIRRAYKRPNLISTDISSGQCTAAAAGNIPFQESTKDNSILIGSYQTDQFSYEWLVSKVDNGNSL